MRYLLRLLLALCFLFLLGFAIKNTTVVDLHFLMGASWQAPLVIILLAFFSAGAICGLLAASGTVIRLRRELKEARSALGRHEEIASSTVANALAKPSAKVPVSPEAAEAGML